MDKLEQEGTQEVCSTVIREKPLQLVLTARNASVSVESEHKADTTIH